MDASSISVLLPVYNAVDSLTNAIDSLEADSVPGVEVIAVDDGSTDGSAALLSRLQDSRPWLRVISRSHVGIVAALNVAYRASSGSFIARMDSDDISLPGRLQHQRRYLDAHPDIGLVAGRVRFGGDAASAAGYAHYVEWVNSRCGAEDLFDMRFVESPFAHPAVMYRRELVEQFGGYREGDFPEDYELWLRWMHAGVRMAAVDREVLIWNDPPQRLSRSDTRYSVEAFYRMKLSYFARWAEKHVATWPEVVVWGAGRITRHRVAFLEEEGARVSAWVDIDPNKIGQKISGTPVIAPEQLPPSGTCFILPFVGARNARKQITQWLTERGYRLAVDFLPLA